MIVTAAAGCHQTVLLAISQGQSDNPKALVGLTDPSARKFIDKDLLSFALPYKRYLELEGQVEESFLMTDEWTGLKERI